MRVTTVNDDVTLFEVGNKLLDEGIDSRASLDKQDDLTRTLELGNELLDGVSTLDICACKAYASYSALHVEAPKTKYYLLPRLRGKRRLCLLCGCTRQR